MYLHTYAYMHLYTYMPLHLYLCVVLSKYIENHTFTLITQILIPWNESKHPQNAVSVFFKNFFKNLI